jgi:hypothetical protein
LSQDYIDGRDRSAWITGLGIESEPWRGSKLRSSVNQDIEESGYRTYSNFGLSQIYKLSSKWSVDGNFEMNRILTQDMEADPVDPTRPLPFGVGGGVSGFTEDYVAGGLGANYRGEDWSWNIRAEHRWGASEDRFGSTTNLVKQLSEGVTLSTSHSYFRSKLLNSSAGELYTGDVSLAVRPDNGHWTFLDRLRYRNQTLQNVEEVPVFGQNTVKNVDAFSSQAVINNFAMNRLSTNRKNQLSLFHGAKYVWDEIDGAEFSGYTDLLGGEVRQDIGKYFDVGLQAMIRNSWNSGTHQYSIGPSVGFSPIENSWISLGYNFAGFEDADFDAAKYAREGIYLKVRLKFDQHTLKRRNKK